MAQFIFSEKQSAPRETRYLLQKKMVTVGTEPGHDVVVQAEFSGIVFTVSQKGDDYEVMPARGKLNLNGQSVSRSTRLHSCDRIEWSGGMAVFLKSGIPVHTDAQAANGDVASGDVQDARAHLGGELQPLTVLQNLASTLQGRGGVQGALFQVLDSLVEMAGAEVGYLLSEIGENSEWKLAASRTGERSGLSGERESRPTKKEMFSNTILEEAIRKREPVYVENIIGHPWAEAASVIEARIFSAACFPLCLGERIFGAVFLLTRSPGRSIKREVLSELSLLATQAALMLASQAELMLAKKENARLKKLVGDVPNGLVFSGQTVSMQELVKKIQKLAPTPLSVLILGETGTGKEVVAREIHSRSDRVQGPFVAVNCAAIPAALLEATLFGHEKGAFTGAVRANAGKFQQAHRGTLLLDEIGDLPLELQAKLLRVLQERRVEPLGSQASVAVDIRLLAATHQDLDQAVKNGRFRQDLFFRLNGASLLIPALRERRDDVLTLAQYFLEKLGSALVLSKDAIEALKAYPWPGNVRELEQVITRAALLSEGPEIQVADLELSVLGERQREFSDESDLFWAGVSEASTLQEAQCAFTQDFVKRTLGRYGDNRAEAAARLGVSERTLYRLLADRTGRVS